MNIFWIFTFLVLFCLYILFGLYMTSNIEQTSVLIFTWVIYSCLWITFINIFLLGYFWSSIRTKTGPGGLRGPEGESGDQGIDGTCGVTSTQANIIKEVSEMLDQLYKNKRGQNIINQETKKFPNEYLNNKIATMGGSKQYNILIQEASALGKTPLEIQNYIKGIWTTWFNLIYVGNPVWFNDKLADEDYSWTGGNPFDEIRKYDMYYWGLTPSFRPLKAEICRTSSGLYSKLPYNKKTNISKARLKVITTNDYQRLAGDEGTKGIPDVSWWRSKPVTIGPDTYYPVGDIITTGNSDWNNQKTGNTVVGDLSYKAEGWTGPDKMTILVAGDVKTPVNYRQLMWHGGTAGISTGSLVCPNGYESMGDILGYQWGNLDRNYWQHGNKPKCVPRDCLEEIPAEIRRDHHSEWWHGKTRTSHNVLNDTSIGHNLFRSNNNKPYYKIKDSCLSTSITRVSTGIKDLEPETATLGIGWYGHPYKLDPKYSIFSYLGLIPEGIIVHKSTGRRFYIIHYSGEDVNKFLVLDYNDGSHKFDTALQVDNNPLVGKVEMREIFKKDTRQQWVINIQSDKKFFNMKNIYNNRYLYLDLDANNGNSIFSTIPTNEQLNENILFSFIPAYGTHLNVLEESHS